MARTAKKAKTVTISTVETVAADAEIRSIGEVAADVVAALPAPDAEAETVADAEAAPVAETATGREIFIPLNKLKKSPRNARKTPHSAETIETYAASIAAKGILQNLVVEPELDADGQPNGFYFVTIGEGRRMAQMLRVKRKEIKKTEAIRCVVDTANDPTEISLDENVTRTDMHPADQFEAFRELADNRGWSAVDIAARFGVSEHVVRQRLKLGAVSPKLLQVYREGGLNLDQLQAFAITDDHKRQEQVFENLHYNKEARIIRRDLTASNVPATDRRTVFIGPQAYTEAGGTIIRDLFTEDRGGYYDDPALLDRLVMEKLEGIAADIRAEGWKWVEASMDFSYAHGLRRAYPEDVALSDEDEAAYSAAQEEHDRLAEEMGSVDEYAPEDEARFMELEAELKRLDAKRQAYDPDELARGGVFISLYHDGTARIERGFIRPEDEAPEPEPEEAEGVETVIDGVRVNADGEVIEDGMAPDPDSDDDDEEPEGDAGQPVSDLLTRDLTAHRTLGLRLALGEQPDIALIAVTHTLAVRTFYPGVEAYALDIRPVSTSLGGHAVGIEDTAAAKMLADRHAGWAQDMPKDVADLWDFIAGLDPVSVMALFAHCASLTVNAVRLPWEHGKRHAHATADKLATAVALDMSQHWTPTVSAYLGRVTKAHIRAAVSEAAGDEAAERLTAKKKQEMAEAAEEQLAGTGWLPPLLRTERSAWADASQVEGEADTVADMPEALEMAEPEPEEPGDGEAMPFETPDPDEEAVDPDAPEADEPIPDTPDPDADVPAEPETAPDTPDPNAEDGGEDVDGEVFHDAAE